jgi:hypothetical protein
MSGEKRYNEAEAHQLFAISINGEVWELLDKESRTTSDDELMIHAAHASCYHWLQSGTGLHQQRGEWLIARVYSVLNIANPALRHANRCLELTEEYSGLMEDFDLAFAYECVARANAIAGNHEQALKYMQFAEEAGQKIKGEEDKKIFFTDFGGGNWNGLR